MFSKNPFSEYRATQQQVQEKKIDEISKDKVGAYLKKVPASSAQAGDMMARPTPGAPGSAAKMDKGVKKFVKRTMGTKTAADKLTGKAKVPATEGTQYVIPEEIPANERTAFHGAAAAAAKAGKSHFNFAGKKHPVTMKKNTASAIADQKEGYYKDMEIKRQDKAMGAKPVPAKKKKEAKGGGKEGDIEMNPKMEKNSKSTQTESVNYHNKMSSAHTNHGNAHESEVTNGGHDDHDYAGEAHHDASRAHKAASVAYKNHGANSSQYKSAAAKAKSATSDAKEQSSDAGRFKKTAPPKPMGESKIRAALKSVLSEKNRGDHYKSATEPEMMKDKLKGKGAEDMMKGAQDEIAKGPDAHLDEPEMIKKDRAKMTSNVKKSAMRKNDNPKGDSNIVPSGTPMKDPIAMKAESYDKMSGLKDAYASMYETQTEEVKDAD